ncbi:MAG: aminotransferase class I/II-fold pyridoxal phosphate-dependent enzyme [Deltaproteobacteria bacterium]|nr:aminotransferase class I/II-fold pyridoxal phosphate-dependent enzyme [Deltaproteobacteria bacterium]
MDCGFRTRCLHAGEHVGQPQHATHANAIYQTSTFVFDSAQQGAEYFSGEKEGYIYTRIGNPTVKVLEAKINALEGGDLKRLRPDVRVSTLAYSSGMAAIAGTLLAVASAGDTLLMGDVVYGATEHLASQVLRRLGIRTVEVDTSNLDAVDRAIRAHPEARAIFFETPTNPMLAVTDISELCRVVRAVNPDIRVAVDNTFATPYLQRPLELGADIVVHSTTKYIGGHGTVVGGLMTTIHDDVKNAAYTVIKDVGSVPSPFDAWLINMGLKTLPVRMERCCANALGVARFLESHPKIERVFYPGLESSPFHALARRQMKHFGGMVSFEVRGGLEAGRRLMDNVRLFTLAVSLGSVDSLIQHPASMTHASVPREKREKGGVTDGLVRVSVGIEDVEDLIRALDEGLTKA